MSAKRILSNLSEYLSFKNGKSSPERNDKAPFPVFGSNGLIGYADKTNSGHNTIIIGRVGSYCGSVHFSDKPCWVSDNAIICTSKNLDDSLFWYYFLTFSDLNQYRSGSGQPLLNQSTLNSISRKVPQALTERVRIGEILASLDRKRRLNHQIHQTLEQVAQTIFKSWFVDFEPVNAKIAALKAGGSEEDSLRAAMQAISGKDETELTRLQAEQHEQYAELRTTAKLFPSVMQDSAVGEIPKGWSALPLYETAQYINGAAFKATDFIEDRRGLPIIKIAELKHGITAGTKYTKVEGKKKYQVTDGSVLYSWSGSPETSLEVFKWFGGDGWLNQHIFKLNFGKGQSEHFTYFLLKQIKPLLVRTAQQKQTTGLGHITVADMKRIKVPYPNHLLLSAFSKFIGPLYERSSAAVQESGTLASLRDNLLPNFLSGELSIMENEEQLVEAEEITGV